MPIYEYVCNKCNSRFEELVRVPASAKAAECPECHGSGKRVPSTFSSFTVTSSGQTLPMAGGCACGSASCSCNAN